MGLFNWQIDENELEEMLEMNLSWTSAELSSDDRSQRKYEKKYKKTILRYRDKIRKRKIKDLKKTAIIKKYAYNNNIQTSKLIMSGIFINCTIVELYSMIAMIVMNDLSSLSTLLGSVLTEGISFAIYSCKAYAETREEKRLELERDINGLNNEDEE